MKKQFTSNLGSVDAKALGLDYTKCCAGDVVELTAKQAEALTAKYKGILVEPESVKGVAPAPGITGVSDDSPVHESNVAEAIATIENMRSKDKLQHVIDNDPRASVKEAAKKRLASL